MRPYGFRRWPAATVADEARFIAVSQWFHTGTTMLTCSSPVLIDSRKWEVGKMKRFTVLVAALVLWPGAVAVSAQEMEAATTYEARTSEGQVSIEVQPEWRDGRMVVSLSANTHSVDLSALDLTESVRLLAGGMEYSPVGSGALSGHHAKATLTFALAVRPDTFKLRIRNVPDVPERMLEWPKPSR